MVWMLHFRDIRIVARIGFPALAFLPLLLLLLSTPASAQDDAMCVMCHRKPDITGERNGAEVSMFVDPAAHAGSAHQSIGCSGCHEDADPDDLPHEDDLAPVDCGRCHEVQAKDHRRSLHGQAAERGDELAPSCVTCHGKHDILSHLKSESRTAMMNIPLLCGRCHHEGSPVSLTHDIPQDRILENYSLSIHGEGLFKQGLTVTAVCVSCHTSHRILPHTDPESSIHRDRVAETCTQCHGLIEQVHRKVIEGRKWEEEANKIPVCADCHSPHKIRNVQYQVGTQDCMACHENRDLTMESEGRSISLHVNGIDYANSSHSGIACAQCHTDIDPTLDRACETIEAAVDCSICHAEVVARYQESAHGTLLGKGDPDAPGCLDCHSKHATLSQAIPVSPTFPRNIPNLCGKCHREGKQAARRIDSDVPDIVSSYEDSIHGRGLLSSGLVVTATCASCHGAHGELPPTDPRSSIHKNNVAGTCGKCHYGIQETFKKSIHWPGNVDTDRELPSCKDCHSSHTISRKDKPGFRLRMMDQCGRCHEEQAETFLDTFHGKVSRLGEEGAAECSDCHGTHDILPATDTRSRLSRDNVVETCAQCHSGAHRRFAGYLTHATHHDPDKYPWLFWVFWSMTTLLVGTLVVALLHTGAWLWRLSRTRDEWKHAAAVPGEKLYRRFNRTQRTLHLTMMISFFTLALTGMSLKFSYMGWAQTVSRVLGGFAGMGLVHRMGACVLIAVFVSHLLDVRRRKRRAGMSWLKTIFGPGSIMFNWNDLKEAGQSIRWFLGRGPRPRYGRFTYWEKFDYFAVFWGVAIIGSTGFILWFPEIFTHIVPGWFVNVATIIHSDEALLAVGFIFTIHFFNTHFRPDKFPMDPVIFTGRVTVEELKYDKPREYEAAMANGDFEQRLVDPFPQRAERAARIFGFIALAVGLTLIALIVYAMIFSYR